MTDTVDCQTVMRSLRFLSRWATKRIGEFAEFRCDAMAWQLRMHPDITADRHNAPDDEGTARSKKMTAEQSILKVLGHIGKGPVVRIVGPHPAADPRKTDERLDAALNASMTFLRDGRHPLVDGITGNVQPRGMDAIGIRLHKGRILWLELNLNVMFWTLRPREGERIMSVIFGTWERIDRLDAPAKELKSVRDSVVLLRRNAYSDDPRFSLVAESELPDGLQHLNDALGIVERWLGDKSIVAAKMSGKHKPDSGSRLKRDARRDLALGCLRENKVPLTSTLEEMTEFIKDKTGERIPETTLWRYLEGTAYRRKGKPQRAARVTGKIAAEREAVSEDEGGDDLSDVDAWTMPDDEDSGTACD